MSDFARSVKLPGTKVEDFEVADISAADHTFVKGVTQAVYVDKDATVVLRINGQEAAWKLLAGVNPYRATRVIRAGTDAGVVIRGLY